MATIRALSELCQQLSRKLLGKTSWPTKQDSMVENATGLQTATAHAHMSHAQNLYAAARGLQTWALSVEGASRQPVVLLVPVHQLLCAGPP